MSKVKTKANGNVILPFWKTSTLAYDIKYATDGSACFDLAFCPYGHMSYKGFDETNAAFERPFNNFLQMTVMPGDRIMVPTGVILDIPDGYAVKVHPRSGISLKQGLTLINCEGVIDSDYVEETFLLIVNNSRVKAIIDPGTRLAQAELVPYLKAVLEETETKPGQKTDRIGGMGSTGTDTK